MRSCGFDWIVSLAWMCHGCGTTLASVVKMNSSIDTMQQIGSIVFPGISSIIMVNMLDIEGSDSNVRLLTFSFTPVRHILPCSLLFFFLEWFQLNPTWLLIPLWLLLSRFLLNCLNLVNHTRSQWNYVTILEDVENHLIPSNCGTVRIFQWLQWKLVQWNANLNLTISVSGQVFIFENTCFWLRMGIKNSSVLTLSRSFKQISQRFISISIDRRAFRLSPYSLEVIISYSLILTLEILWLRSSFAAFLMFALFSRGIRQNSEKILHEVHRADSLVRFILLNSDMQNVTITSLSPSLFCLFYSF